MTALNFTDHDDDNTIAIRAMARDAYDHHDDRLDFSDALERLRANDALDADLSRALEELDEDEAAELYDAALEDLEQSWTDF